MIHGTTIYLYETKQNGTDEFDIPMFQETKVPVHDVLIGQPESTDVVNTLNIYGKRAEYTLAIPKGDTHEWENKVVEFFGRKWRVFTIPTQGIEENIPLRWNKKVMVERYE